MREEFEVEFSPYRQRVQEIINEVWQAEGMSLISEQHAGVSIRAVPRSEDAGLRESTNRRGNGQDRSHPLP